MASDSAEPRRACMGPAKGTASTNDPEQEDHSVSCPYDLPPAPPPPANLPDVSVTMEDNGAAAITGAAPAVVVMPSNSSSSTAESEQQEEVGAANVDDKDVMRNKSKNDGNNDDEDDDSSDCDLVSVPRVMCDLVELTCDDMLSTAASASASASHDDTDEEREGVRRRKRLAKLSHRLHYFLSQLGTIEGFGRLYTRLQLTRFVFEFCGREPCRPYEDLAVVSLDGESNPDVDGDDDDDHDAHDGDDDDAHDEKRNRPPNKDAAITQNKDDDKEAEIRKGDDTDTDEGEEKDKQDDLLPIEEFKSLSRFHANDWLQVVTNFDELRNHILLRNDANILVMPNEIEAVNENHDHTDKNGNEQQNTKPEDDFTNKQQPLIDGSTNEQLDSLPIFQKQFQHVRRWLEVHTFVTAFRTRLRALLREYKNNMNHLTVSNNEEVTQEEENNTKPTGGQNDDKHIKQFMKTLEQTVDYYKNRMSKLFASVVTVSTQKDDQDKDEDDNDDQPKTTMSLTKSEGRDNNNRVNQDDQDKANQHLYETLTSFLLPDLYTTDSVEQLISKLFNHINNAMMVSLKMVQSQVGWIGYEWSNTVLTKPTLVRLGYGQPSHPFTPLTLHEEEEEGQHPEPLLFTPWSIPSPDVHGEERGDDGTEDDEEMAIKRLINNTRTKTKDYYPRWEQTSPAAAAVTPSTSRVIGRGKTRASLAASSVTTSTSTTARTPSQRHLERRKNNIRKRRASWADRSSTDSGAGALEPLTDDLDFTFLDEKGARDVGRAAARAAAAAADVDVDVASHRPGKGRPGKGGTETIIQGGVNEKEEDSDWRAAYQNRRGSAIRSELLRYSILTSSDSSEDEMNETDDSSPSAKRRKMSILSSSGRRGSVDRRLSFSRVSKDDESRYSRGRSSSRDQEIVLSAERRRRSALIENSVDGMEGKHTAFDSPSRTMKVRRAHAGRRMSRPSLSTSNVSESSASSSDEEYTRVQRPRYSRSLDGIDREIWVRSTSVSRSGERRSRITVRSKSLDSAPRSTSPRKRKRFTDEEKNAIRLGVGIYGVGKWAQIKQHFKTELKDRTSVNIKDCYRTMVKNNEI